MGTLSIVNTLGIDVEIVEASPYNFSPSIIKSGQSATAPVVNDFNRLILKVSILGNQYAYDLNKGHWYGGDGENHYPNANSKVNIILTGDRGSYIETNYNYAPASETAICKYSSDTKALDKI
ncbi:hypothetical protein WAE56_02755 [Iodobacter sp. LRB]|uniref:hypothetical protein n=1 Tax=unclassified Iodobacter TaxID=235634 RepID=UPI000C0CAB3E|nr:hypothetical protein [Iodobacter sp. BJB302]PHV02967.1 hypothetical protein CSQ88_04175 [Iodobacter sp. BJB302]